MAPSVSLRDALTDVSRPVFLFGTVPPMEGTDLPKCKEICEKFVARGRALATDGYIVYDIQEEKGRVPDPRPFPFRPMMEPSGYAGLLKAASGKDSVVYKCVVEHSEGAFEDWVTTAKNVHGVETFNLVGGATSTVQYSGPTMSDAAKVLQKHNLSFGGVTIAERHTKKGNEHSTIASKVEMGAQWFISQAIYEPQAMINTINEYGELCKKNGKSPVRVLLTFAPCGRPKTMKFIHWLGVNVPADTEKAILEAANPVMTSVELLCDMCAKILLETKASGVPLGISVESVSIFREEIDATHELFRRTQALMLDDQGIPWSVRWSHVAVNDKRTSFDSQRPLPNKSESKLLMSAVDEQAAPAETVMSLKSSAFSFVVLAIGVALGRMMKV